MKTRCKGKILSTGMHNACVIPAIFLVIGLTLFGCSNPSGGNNFIPLVISGTLSSSGSPDASLMGDPLGGPLGGPMRAVSMNPSQIFRCEVGADSKITGKLEDGALIYKLTGRYDPLTRGFSVQAKSSMVIFSLTGTLNASGDIDAGKSHAAIQVIDGGEWKTITCSITPGDQTVNGDVTESGGVTIPAICQGKWKFKDLGLEYLVTENSITMYDSSMLPAAPGKYVTDITVVELTTLSPTSWELLVRSKYYGIGTGNAGVPYTGKFYVSTSFDSILTTAIGTATVNDIYFNQGGSIGSYPLTTALPLLPYGPKLFVAPYASDTGANVDKEGDGTYLHPANTFSPLFIGALATTNAKAATAIKAFSGFTLALMH